MDGNKQEVDLVLVIGVWRVGGSLLHAEVIPQGASAEVGLRLRNEFRPPHIRVPQRGGINGDLDTLLAQAICRILVAGREVDIFGDGSRSVTINWVSYCARYQH